MLRSVLAAACAALVLAGAAPASAAPVPMISQPLTVHVGERGQLQATRTGEPGGVFFPPASATGDAGFFLAFPAGAAAPPPASVSGAVFGFRGAAGPSAVQEYAPVAQGPITGAGTAAAPWIHQTQYAAADVAVITQTTTYVAGEERFAVYWSVQNTGVAPLAFKALAAGDLHVDGTDAGTGVFTAGPPRFIGVTSLATGRSAGFGELPAPAVPWSHYEALAFDAAWARVEGAAAATGPSVANGVVGTPADGAAVVEWDQHLAAPLLPGATASFGLTVHAPAPAAVRLTPPTARGPQQAPLPFSLTAQDGAGAPLAARTVRFSITGANPSSGQTVTDAAGNATIAAPGGRTGEDVVIAFVDLDNDGVRGPGDPQASAVATFADESAPACAARISRGRPGGPGRRGRPLRLAVRCTERATATVRATLRAPRNRQVRLATLRRVVPAGRWARLRITLPRSVRSRYGNRTVRAAVRVAARDAGGNAATATAARRLRLAPRRAR